MDLNTMIVIYRDKKNNMSSEALESFFYVVVKKAYNKYYTYKNNYFKNKIDDSDFYQYIESIIKEFLDNEYKLDIDRYISGRIQFLLQSEDFIADDRLLKKDVVSNLIKTAREGNQDSKTKLLYHYMYFIEKIDNLDDDERQQGYLYLLTIINRYFEREIKCDLHEYISNNLRSTYYKKIIKERKNNNIVYMDDEIETEQSNKFINDYISKLELTDMLSKVNINDGILRVLDSIMEGYKKHDIALSEGVSDTAIAMRLSCKRLQKSLIDFYK